MTVLAMKFYNSGYATRLQNLGFEPINCTQGFAELGRTRPQDVKVIVTSGFYGASAADMDLFPNLGLICSVGTGFENIDLEVARERGILVTYGAGINASAVADQAIALLLSAVRRIPQQDRIARAGGWSDGWDPAPLASGKKIGIYGLGRIGEAIARRAQGFDMDVFYYTRSPKPHLPYTYIGSLLELARASDYLVCAVPGGDDTFHAIDSGVLEALGPHGFLVNVARGSVVATDVLAEALQSGTIAGAALDVYENEPVIPEVLREIDNLVLTLHTSARAPEIQDISAALIASNIHAFLKGEPVVTPVPGSAHSYHTDVTAN